MRWVRENIAAFGGDPECITLMGQSAGAHSVMTLCNTPLTKGMFKRAIIQSTAGLSALYYQDEMFLSQAEDEGTECLKVLGVSSIDEARKLDPWDISNKLGNIQFSSKHIWFPKTDGYVLPVGTTTSIMLGRQHKLDYLIGATSEETGSMPGFMSEPSIEGIRGFAHLAYPEDVDGYMRSVDITSPSAIQDTVFMQYENDKLGAVLAWQQLEMNRNGETTYMYYYTMPSPGNRDRHLGAFHGSELPYVFQTLERDGRPYQEKDYHLSNIMCKYWVNFIKTGNPNGEGLPYWNRPVNSCYEALELGEYIGMVLVPNSQNRSFVVKYMLDRAYEEMERDHVTEK